MGGFFICKKIFVKAAQMGGFFICKKIFVKRVKHELPEQQDGTFYIVSALVARAAGREDFVIVNDTVRDNDGRIIGCQSFAHV